MNIGGLSVALTAVVFIMMWVGNELSFDSYHPDAGNIFLVQTTEQLDKTNADISENSPFPLAAAVSVIPGVAFATNIQRTQKSELTLKVQDRLFAQEWGLYVDRNFFNMFSYQFLAGDAQSFLAHPYSLLITASKAQLLFGKAQAVGQIVRIDSTNYSVRAVVKDNPVNSSFQFDLLMPMSAKLDTRVRMDDANYWPNLAHKTFVRLKPGTSINQVAKQMTAILKKNIPSGNFSVSMLPLADMHLYNGFAWSAFKHGSLKSVKIFTMLAVLLLLSASINYVNLSIAHAASRSKEISVRKIVGARRGQLFLQMITQSFVTSFLTLAVTTLLIPGLLPFFNWFTGIDFQFNPFEPLQACILLGSTLALVLLTGIYPAILLSSINPVNIFRKTGAFNLTGLNSRKVLLISQFALSAVITIAAIVVYKQLRFMQQQDNRYNKAQIFTVNIPFKDVYRMQSPVLVDAVKNELRAQKQVKLVSATNLESVVNNQHETAGGLNWEGKDPTFKPAYVDFSADSDFNKIMHFNFVEGSWFDHVAAFGHQDVVLNETAVKEFALKAPVVGKRFNNGIISGVVKDFHYKSMHEKIAPVVISVNPGSKGSFMVETYPGMTAEGLQAVREAWRKFFPGDTFVYRFLDEEFDRLYHDDQRALSFTLAFSGVSILISCIGLLGMIVFTTAQRKKEIGIRKVMGASVANIVKLVSTDYLKLVFISVLIAFPIAWWATRKWLEDFAYRIDINWQVYVISGIFILIIAFVTICSHVIRAAMVNPVKSLRSE